MKRKLLFLWITLISTFSFSQTKNFIDRPYIETSASVDTLVTPDRIYLSILIAEKDSKGKISVEKLENRMAKELRSLGINLDKQLFLTDLGSNFKKYFLRKQDIDKVKNYSLVVYDALTAGRVIQALEKAQIANVNLQRTEYSKIDQLVLTLKSRAMKKAKTQAEYLVKPIGQHVGKAIYIADQMNNPFYAGEVKALAVRSAPRQKAEFDPIDVEFRKIRVSSRVSVKFVLLD